MKIINKANKVNNVKTTKLNWAEIRRKAKTLALVIIFTAAAAFYMGMKYQEGLNNQTQQKVTEAVSQVAKQTTQSKQ